MESADAGAGELRQKAGLGGDSNTNTIMNTMMTTIATAADYPEPSQPGRKTHYSKLQSRVHKSSFTVNSYQDNIDKPKKKDTSLSPVGSKDSALMRNPYNQQSPTTPVQPQAHW